MGTTRRTPAMIAAALTWLWLGLSALIAAENQALEARNRRSRPRNWDTMWMCWQTTRSKVVKLAAVAAELPEATWCRCFARMGFDRPVPMEVTISCLAKGIGMSWEWSKGATRS